MKHRHTGRKLGRIKKQRVALIKTLLGSLAFSGKIRTTEAKAKEIRPIFERLITAVKKKSVNPVEMKRFLTSRLPVKSVKKMIERVDSYKERKGGYTRITKVEQRKSDGARMAIIELV